MFPPGTVDNQPEHTLIIHYRGFDLPATFLCPLAFPSPSSKPVGLLTQNIHDKAMRERQTALGPINTGGCAAYEQHLKATSFETNTPRGRNKNHTSKGNSTDLIHKHLRNHHSGIGRLAVWDRSSPSNPVQL